VAQQAIREGAIGAVTQTPAMAAGDGGVVQLRRCVRDRDRPPGTAHQGRLVVCAAVSGCPRQVLAAALAA